MDECKMLVFDTSTKSTGVALYESGKYVKHQLVDFSTIKDTDQRMKQMIYYLYETINEIKPQIVVTEMTVVTRNAQAQRNLSMLLGALYGKCVENDIFYYSFRPTEWRKLVCDNGEKPPRKRDELKAWSVEKVVKLHNLQDVGDDISDAILLGQAYVNKFTE